MTKREKADGSPRLTVAMIARDAADLLPASLSTVHHLAYQVVVLDTGSTDATIDVARQHGAVVQRAAWQDDFAAARNECLRYATGDWVLWLDAGETIDATAARQLRNFLNLSADKNKAYVLFVERPAQHAAGSFERIGQLRLHVNQRGLRFAGRLREQILPSLLAAGIEVDALDLAIRRSEFDHDPIRQSARAERDLRLADLAQAEDGDQPATMAARADAVVQLGRIDEARDLYRGLVATADRGSSEMLEGYYGLLTTMDGQPELAEAQIATCLEALETYPLDAQLLCGMGSYLLQQQRLDLAARCYELAVRHGQIDPTIWHLADLADVAAACLSLVHQSLGDTDAAESVLRDALETRPQSERLRRQLIELYVKAGRQREALDQCRRLSLHAPNRDQFACIVRGAALVAAGQAADGIPTLADAYGAGCRDTLCLRWLAAGYSAMGDWDRFESVVAEWERQEPASREVEATRQLALRRRQAVPADSPATTPNQPSVPRPLGSHRHPEQLDRPTLSVHIPDG